MKTRREVYGFDNENQELVAEFLGAGSMAEIEEWFSGMNRDEILASLNECWPQDDNAALADQIIDIL